MTFISPVSFVLLLGYGATISRLGPLAALKVTTLGCAAVLFLSGVLIAKLDGIVDASSTARTITKYLIGALFVFRESYVQLITSQHWSFLSSVLTPKQSSRWFAPISGLTSVTSAVAATSVGKMSQVLGLSGVLIVAGVVLGASLILGEVAYGVAELVRFYRLAFGYDLCTSYEWYTELYHLHYHRMDSTQQMNTLRNTTNPKQQTATKKVVVMKRVSLPKQKTFLQECQRYGHYSVKFWLARVCPRC